MICIVVQIIFSLYKKFNLFLVFSLLEYNFILIPSRINYNNKVKYTELFIIQKIQRKLLYL